MTTTAPNNDGVESETALDRARAREAALREILAAISAARAEEQPVLDTIVHSAARLCEARAVGLSLLNQPGTGLFYASMVGLSEQRFPSGFEFDLDGPLQVARTVREARTIHTADLADDPLYHARDPVRVKMVDELGYRTFLTVPLLKDGTAIGCLNLNRDEVRPFDDGEIALVETFAAQAVIAIDKVRQFREVQTRLEREQASREILQVISQSRDDDRPVFDVILENAARLCDAPHALLLMRNGTDTRLELVASNSRASDFVAYLRAHPHELDDPGSLAVRVVHQGQVLHVDDVLAEQASNPDPASQLTAAVELERMRSCLLVPLRDRDRTTGVICLYRLEVNPFTDDEIALVETFAAQAVIAIENVRQFRELQARLAREAATGEVLGVISQSRDDDSPVFETILKNAQALCDAPMSGLILAKPGDKLQFLAAQRGIVPEQLSLFYEGRMPLDGDVSYAARAIVQGRLIAFEDMGRSDLYKAGSPVVRAMVDEVGIRSVLFVPLMLDGSAIGCITLFRFEINPFQERHVNLVETFAAQAVIAIENVRQFKALETLNAELGDRVTRQVGEIERMGRLKRFLPAAVADVIVSSGNENLLSSHRALLGVLFADIRGFTAFCETAEPEETIEVLQTYHQEMGRLISEHGAGVDHRSGDGIMVIFNDPLPCDDPAGDALRLALAMRARMQDLCRTWRKLGHRLGFGVGISLGYATVGMVGYEGRHDYTASGTAVNLAARLCDHAADREILLSPRAAAALEDVAELEPAGVLNLKGFNAPVEVVRVAGPGPGA